MTQRLFSSTFVVRRALGAAAILATIATTAPPAAAIDTTDTRMLSQPALSARQLAFIYAGDLYVCDLDGHNVRRLTSDEGIERSPAFSPDGTQLAFSAEYDGNVDVYIVPVDGRRAAAPDLAPRRRRGPGLHARRHAGPVHVAARGLHGPLHAAVHGAGEGRRRGALPIPNASRGSYYADGTRIAYNPLNPAHLQWKHYRGGSAATIILYDPKTHATEKIAQPATRANDVDPQWLGGMLYFRSDRDGEFNLYRYDPASKQVTRLTSHDDFPVLGLSVAAGKIAYEQAGYLHLFDVASKQARRLTIGIGSRPRRAAAALRQGTGVDPRDVGLALGRPHRHGVPRRDRHRAGREGRPAQHHRHDGRARARAGVVARRQESRLLLRCGRRVRPAHPRPGRQGRAEGRARSPAAASTTRRCGRPTAGTSRSATTAAALYVLDLASGAISKVVTEPIYRPGAFSDTTCSWSPDSKWLAYTTTSRAQIQSARVWSVDTKASFPVTDGLSDVGEPVVRRSGKYLYLLASTDAGPVRDWFSQANADMRSTSAIYLVVLKKGEVSPLARESDEEKAEAPTRADRGKRRKGRRAAKRTKDENGRRGEPQPAVAATVIDTDGLGAGSWRCRCRPATIPACRAARPASCSTCDRPTASRRCSSSTSRPARPRRGYRCRRLRRHRRRQEAAVPQRHGLPRGRHVEEGRRHRGQGERRRRCRSASIRRPNGRRSSTRPGASTATTSTPPTTTAATGRR